MSGLLMVHIVVAVLTIAASATSLVAVWLDSKFTQVNLYAMWGSFAVTAGTGVALVVITPSTLMHTCVLMTAYVIALSAVQVYANRRAHAQAA